MGGRGARGAKSLARTARREWPRLVLETLVVVLGITISFLLNEWRTSVRESQVAERTMASLRGDLVADSTYLSRRVGHLERMVAAYDRLLEEGAGEKLPSDSLDVYMDMLITYVAFPPRDVAYEELKQTGSSRLIQNRGALEKVIGLHENAYARVAEWDEINRRFILERMIPYVDDEGPYVSIESTAGVATGYAPVYRALAERDRFLNLVRTNRLYKETQAFVYRSTTDSIRATLEQIDSP